MQITVKATGLLTRHLPAERRGNEADLEVSEGTTPQGVLLQLGLKPDGSYLIVLNGESLPRAERATRVLESRDKIAIMPPLKGG